MRIRGKKGATYSHKAAAVLRAWCRGREYILLLYLVHLSDNTISPITLANILFGKTQLLEALARHIFCLVCWVPLVAHATTLGAKDGILPAELGNVF